MECAAISDQAQRFSTITVWRALQAASNGNMSQLKASPAHDFIAIVPYTILYPTRSDNIHLLLMIYSVSYFINELDTFYSD